MKRLSVAGVLLIAAALWGGYLWVRHVGVVMERQRRTADSLHTAQAQLAAQSNAALALRDSLASIERRRLATIAQQRTQLTIIVKRTDSLQAALRAQTVDTVRFDSLIAGFAQREAVLTASRDTALSLWRSAAASRDTLAALLRASQGQNAALSVALVRAQRTPFFERPPIKIATLAAAYLLGRLTR